MPLLYFIIVFLRGKQASYKNINCCYNLLRHKFEYVFPVVSLPFSFSCLGDFIRQETIAGIQSLFEHEFEQALGVGDGQGSLVCCSPWGDRKLDTTASLN